MRFSAFTLFACFAGNLFAAEAPDYAKHIAPLFQQHCLDCHGKQDPEGGLVMETHAELMKGGDTGAAILPGKSVDSLLVKFLEGRSGKEGKNQFMPPGKKKHLEPAEIALIKSWIDAGAIAPADGGALTLNIPKITPKVAPAKSVTALACSPRTELIAAGRYGEIELLDAVTHKAVRTLTGHRGSVTALAFSADGAQLFAAAGEPGLVGEVRHWSVGDGKLLRSWDAHPDSLYALALAPDGKTLATGSYDQRVKLWDAATGEELRTLKGHNGAVFGLAFRPDGRVLASASADRTVKLWNSATGARLDTFSQPLKELFTLAFAPDGKTLAAGGADNRIRLWRVSDKAIEGSNKLLYSRFGHEGSILQLAFSADGQTLVSSASDKTVKLWNAAEVTERSQLEKQSDWAPALAVTSSGQLIIGRLDGSVGYYDSTTGAAVTPGPKKTASILRGDELRQSLRANGATASSPVKQPVGLHDGSRGLSGATPPVASSISISTPAGVHDSFSHPSGVQFLSSALPVVSAALRPPATLLQASGLRQRAKTKIGDLVEIQAGSETGAPKLKRPLLSAANRNGVFAQAARDADKKAANVAAAKKKAADAKSVMAGKPVLTRLEPPGIQRGVATEVKLIGKNLSELTALKFTNPKLKAELVKVDPKKPDEALVKITADAALPRITVYATAVSASGESAALKLYVDDLPQIYSAMPSKAGVPVKLAALPLGVWGFLKESGEHDEYEFTAKAGQTLVFDLEARRIGSKAVTPALHLLDASGAVVASNYGMENNTDPLLAFQVPRDGRYVVRVREVTLEGSADHTYHLTLGELPCVTGFFPISAGTDRDLDVTLTGYNLASPTVRVKTGALGKTKLPLGDTVRTRGTPELMVTDGVELIEAEPNDSPVRAQMMPAPGSVNGRLQSSGDNDLFAFEAKLGQQLVVETLAARAGSPADTKIEVLDARGEPVPRILMQAVRDSWINFRRQDANNPGVRIANWEEMDLNQYLWFNGDIQRVFRMPKGPDADMIFFANGGKRRSWFDTTATQHALDDPCYVVEPRPVGAKLVPNGLPVFTVHYANDDDGERELGSDSRLLFTAPAEGKYLVRITDTRDAGSDRHNYRLTVRPAQPDFAVSLNALNLTVAAGAGASFGFKVDRHDGFDGPIRVELADAPKGFTATTPVDVDPGHLSAEATLFAAEDAKATKMDWSRFKITATGTINGKLVSREVKPFTAVTVGPKPKSQLVMQPGGEEGLQQPPALAPEKPLELTIAPGETVPAMLRVVRHSETNLINLDVDGLPFGVIVDNIGLNGVQIRPGENEREIFLAAARWVPEQDALCFAVAQSARNDAVGVPGTQTSFPVLLKVRKAPAAGAASVR